MFLDSSTTAFQPRPEIQRKLKQLGNLIFWNDLVNYGFMKDAGYASNSLRTVCLYGKWFRLAQGDTELGVHTLPVTLCKSRRAGVGVSRTEALTLG